MARFDLHSILLGVLMLSFLSCNGSTNPKTALAQEDPDSELRRLIEERIATAPEGFFACSGKRICAPAFIPPFYKERSHKPAWLSEGKLLPQAAELISVIEKTPEEALQPEDYHLSRLQALTATVPVTTSGADKPDPKQLCDLELLLTDAFFQLGAHLLNGRVTPDTLHPAWEAQPPPEVNLAATLATAFEKNTISASLAALAPPREEYRKLKKALATYRHLAQTPDAAPIPEGPSIRPGDHDERIPALRNRLIFLEDMSKPSRSATSKEFDSSTVAGLKRFQGRHGLGADGVLGKKTIQALNQPVAGRLSQLEVNMERWRWAPRDLGEEYILVNTADFSLRLIAGTETVMEMRVVAGRPARVTPVLSGRINYIVLNPYWLVPHSIAVKDLLPKLQKNPGNLAAQHFQVRESQRDDAASISPELIDWSGVTPQNFRYRLRQEPGPKNSLGKIKFLFPNKFGVYLHDTPSRELFRKTERGFSSGCIRIEKPMDLAAYLLRNSSRWTREAIEAQIERGETRGVTVQPSMPVHLLYWTAWVDDSDIVQFREDLYQRDDCLKTVLARPLLGSAGKIPIKKHTPDDDCFGTYEAPDSDNP